MLRPLNPYSPKRLHILFFDFGFVCVLHLFVVGFVCVGEGGTEGASVVVWLVSERFVLLLLLLD